MELLGILLKINVSLLVFYLVYRLALRKLTFYNFNRIYLLASIIISAMIPFVQYSKTAKTGIETWQLTTGISPSIFQNYVTNDVQINFVQIVSTLYWAGVWVMAGIFMLQLFSLIALYFRSKKAHVLGYNIRSTSTRLNPFSFFKSIFVNPQEHSMEALLSILQHENVHAQQWHSLDVIVGEIKRIFCWFNPAAWLMLAAIRENLEFIADRKVLQSGVDRKDYQYSLLSVQQTAANNSLTNNFNFSHLKLRITMMNKTKSSDMHLLKYLLAVPVVAVTPLFLANTSNASVQKEIIEIENSTSTNVFEKSDQKVSDTYSNSDYQPSNEIAMSDYEDIAVQTYNRIVHQETIIKTKFEVLSDPSKQAQTLVVNNPKTQEPAVHFTVDAATGNQAKIYETEVTFVPLADAEAEPQIGHTVTASIKLKDHNEIPIKKEKVASQEAKYYHTYIDGVKQKETVSYKTPDNIHIQYLKGQEAKDYDDAVKDGEGVMLITTK